MLPVVWHPDAELDLLEIIQFIGERNPLAAVNLADLLRNSVVHLSEHPTYLNPAPEFTVAVKSWFTLTTWFFIRCW